MADKKISALDATTTPLAGTEVLPIVQSGTTKKVSVANLTAGRAVSASTLGVGTASPTCSIDVKGGDDIVVMKLDNTSATKATAFIMYRNGGVRSYWGAANYAIGAPYTADDTAICTAGAYAMGFGTNNTDRLRIASDGNISVRTGNLAFTTAGTGIDFSANTNAAGMTSELLNDYEEGTWTPVFADALTGGSASGTAMSGVYTRIGNLVTVSFGFSILDSAGMTGGNTAYFRNLPFATSATNETTASPRLVGATFSGYVSALLGDSRSGFYLLEVTSGGAFSTLTVSDLASSSGTVTLQYFV